MNACRLRTFTLWTGTTLCVLIVAAFVASAVWALMLQLGPVAVYVMAGSVTILIDDPFVDPIAFDQHSHGLSRWAAFARSDNSGSWTAWVQFPLLAVFLVVAIPTAILWRLDRPPKPGHCPCGYDLTGNVSEVCPECGRGFSGAI